MEVHANSAEHQAWDIGRTILAGMLDIRSLMDVMGWKQAAMEARYVHSNENTKRAALAAFEKL